jgi:hypothetical protein
VYPGLTQFDKKTHLLPFLKFVFTSHHLVWSLGKRKRKKVEKFSHSLILPPNLSNLACNSKIRSKRAMTEVTMRCSASSGEMTPEEERITIRDIAVAAEANSKEGDTFYLITQRFLFTLLSLSLSLFVKIFNFYLFF